MTNAEIISQREVEEDYQLSNPTNLPGTSSLNSYQSAPGLPLSPPRSNDRYDGYLERLKKVPYKTKADTDSYADLLIKAVPKREHRDKYVNDLFGSSINLGIPSEHAIAEALAERRAPVSLRFSLISLRN